MEAKMKKMFIAGSVIGVLAVIAAILVSRVKRRKLEEKILGQSLDVILPAQQTTTNILFPLKRGAGKTTPEKNAVKLVQRYVNAKAFSQSYLQITQLKEDGIFGPLTEGALNKLTGVKEVSYSFFKDMQTYLYGAPKYLISAEPYSPGIDCLSPEGPNYTDPSVQKNNIFLKDLIK